VTGIIEKIEDEIIKDVATGNVKLTLNLIDYDCTIVPAVFHVMSDIAERFLKAGFYETGFAKLSGKLLNTKEIVKEVEKQAFGEDIVKIVNKNIVRKEIYGGSPKGSLIENAIDEQEYTQAKQARKLKLEHIKSSERKVSTQNTPNPFASGSANVPKNNPFGGKV